LANQINLKINRLKEQVKELEKLAVELVED